MKRRCILTGFLIFVFIISGMSQTGSVLFNQKAIAVDSFTHLIVKSNLRVVLLVTNQPDSVRIEGVHDFTSKVLIIQNGNSLIVRATSFKDLKNDGAVYIPVRSLRSIEVHDDASIVSYSILMSPQLDLLIEGNCTVSIILKGKLNIRNGDGYNHQFRRVSEKSNTPTYQQSIF